MGKGRNSSRTVATEMKLLCMSGTEETGTFAHFSNAIFVIGAGLLHGVVDQCSADVLCTVYRVEMVTAGRIGSVN